MVFEIFVDKKSTNNDENLKVYGKEARTFVYRIVLKEMFDSQFYIPFYLSERKNAISMSQDTEKNQDVKDFWGSHPYSYGLTSDKNYYRDVGDISDKDIDLDFFDHYMKKVRKRHHDAQKAGQRLGARFIDFDAMAGKKCLDIACGMGWVTVGMAEAGADVTAIDLTPRAVQLCKKHLVLRSLRGNVMVMDAQSMEFPNETFDHIVAWGCLMHMPDTEKAISEIARCLKAGGRVYGYMYNKSSFEFWWKFFILRGIFMGKLVTYKGDVQKIINRYTDGKQTGGNPLAKVYTPREGENMFLKAGFTSVRFFPWGPPEMMDHLPVQKFPLSKYLPYSIKKFLSDRYGWGMIFEAKK